VSAAREDREVLGDRDPILVDVRQMAAQGATCFVLTLNRPDELNAIDDTMLQRLNRAIDEVAADASARAVLITGQGRAFSAGGDLKKYIKLQRDPVRFPQFVTDIHRVFGRLRELPVPVVALVNGVTAAGGLELMLNCDMCIAAESARIGDGHLNFGQMGGGGVLTLLPRLVGIQRASELIYSGRFLSAAEAADWQLVSRVVPDDDLLPAGLEFAEAVAKKSRLAVANAKYVMNAIWSESLSVTAGLRLERERNAFYCLTADDAREGLQAFSEKRPPRFTGR
jgi:enoyl-CoA hydratase